MSRVEITNQPVVVFFPARDEEATVGGVLARVPDQIAGRPVHRIVIDDNSCDETRARAVAAGAEVVAVPSPGGLGAAVRLGLAVAVERGASLVAFMDADGEYDPAELERVCRPILEGQADYVVGSRFAGHIESMQLRRRIGNQVLTRGLAWLTRTPITDGQSGYRVLSGQAATSAVIPHDYNYAQVLTVGLLAAGWRYGEVPIRYRARTSGTSFVRLVPYLRAVVPAVLRQRAALRRHPTPLPAPNSSRASGHRPLQGAGSAPGS